MEHGNDILIYLKRDKAGMHNNRYSRERLNKEKEIKESVGNNKQVETL
jgi:hypothetical protein